MNNRQEGVRAEITVPVVIWLKGAHCIQTLQSVDVYKDILYFPQDLLSMFMIKIQAYHKDITMNANECTSGCASFMMQQ